MSIVVAEDDVTSARVIELTLKKYGYKYFIAENGKIALDYLERTPQVRLVISDIMMPEMDGMELLAQMKGTRELQNIPIIMCTTKADMDTVKRAVQSGCTDYVVKPINPLQLLRKIERVLEKEPPVIIEYRDLVLKTRVDRFTYAEAIKRFSSELNRKIALVDGRLRKQEVLPPKALDELTDMCLEIGAVRLHQLLDGSRDLLNNVAGSESEVFAELQLVLREMKMLQFYLP